MPDWIIFAKVLYLLINQTLCMIAKHKTGANDIKMKDEEDIVGFHVSYLVQNINIIRSLTKL